MNTSAKTYTTTLAFSALFFSMNTPMAPFFFEVGGNSVTINLFRMFFCAFVVYIVLKIRKQKITLSRPLIKSSIIIGALTMGQGLCYLGSVKYIPVGLAALIFYTWPITVALAAPLIGEKIASIRSLGFFLLAFVGLALSLGPSLDSLDMRGVGLAIAGSSMIAAMILIIRRAVSTNFDPLTLSLSANFAGALILLLLMPLLGGWQFPMVSQAFYPAIGVGIAYTCAIITQNFALKNAPAQLAAIIYNLEPIFSILFAFFLLGEVMEGQQYLGAVIVVTALCLYSLYRQRQQKTFPAV